MVQVHVFYSGAVQGVGFRYTTQSLARRFDIAGWVKNLRDGRVELLAEGEQEQISQFLKAIADHFSHHIIEQKVESYPAQGQIKNFMIMG